MKTSESSVQWTLFLDDVRRPEEYIRYISQDNSPFILCRSAEDALLVIDKLGPPSDMWLDHDLGDHKINGLGFLKKLKEIMGNKVPPSAHIISSNPEGREDMVCFLKSWEKSLDL